MDFNWVDLVLLAILAITVLLGLIKGFVRQIFGIAAVIIGLILAVNYYTFASDFFAQWINNRMVTHFIGFIVIFINPGTVLTLAYIMWACFIKRKSGSLHFTAMALFTCAMVGFIILTAVGILFRGPNWEFFWTKAQWPSI